MTIALAIAKIELIMRKADHEANNGCGLSHEIYREARDVLDVLKASQVIENATIKEGVSNISNAVDALIIAGDHINAIRQHRTETGQPLKISKAICDDRRELLRSQGILCQ